MVEHSRLMGTSYLQFILLSVDDDSCDLLIKENQNGRQESWNSGHKDDPPGVLVADGVDKPWTAGLCGLKSDDDLSVFKSLQK